MVRITKSGYLAKQESKTYLYILPHLGGIKIIIARRIYDNLKEYGILWVSENWLLLYRYCKRRWQIHATRISICTFDDFWSSSWVKCFPTTEFS